MESKRVHIALVGGQTIPVYQGIMDENSDMVVLVCSGQTIEEGERIKEEITALTEIRLFDPVNLEGISRKVKKTVEQFGQYERVTLNLAGGTKQWALMFYKYWCDKQNADIISVDQNGMIWNLKDLKARRCSFELDVYTRFKLYGNPLKRYFHFSDYTEEDKRVLSEIREIRKCSYDDFKKLTEDLYKNPFKKKWVVEGSGSSLSWNNEKGSFHFEIITRKGVSRKDLFSPNIKRILPNTAWFEYEVALLLSGWPQVKTILMNCEFQAKNNSPKNEIDIVVQTENKLLFVECKTKIYEDTNIDKFAKAVANYGGYGSKMLFVTDVPMKEKAQEKCDDNKVIAFSLTDGNGEREEADALYALLDRQLDIINK